jgi:NitT/TauT family transport system ATP-binding protein
VSARIEIANLGHRWGDVAALSGISLEVPPGQLAAVVGPSGSGKTTLLRCVAGLVRPTEGEVHVKGRPVLGVPDGVAVVFQDYVRSLFGWMSVRANVELPLRHAEPDASERRRRADEALDEVGLRHAADRYPGELSGGMQQRAAIARALAVRPAILLMDEPFGSVDAQTRADLQDLLLRLWTAHRTTVLFVTHDIDEAVYLADRVVVLSAAPGRVAADVDSGLGRPRDQIETRSSVAFATSRHEIAELLRRHREAGDRR